MEMEVKFIFQNGCELTMVTIELFSLVFHFHVVSNFFLRLSTYPSSHSPGTARMTIHIEHVHFKSKKELLVCVMYDVMYDVMNWENIYLCILCVFSMCFQLLYFSSLLSLGIQIFFKHKSNI